MSFIQTNILMYQTLQVLVYSLFNCENQLTVVFSKSCDGPREAMTDSLAQKQVFLVDSIQFYVHDLIQFLLLPRRPQNENKHVTRIKLIRGRYHKSPRRCCHQILLLQSRTHA
jgi:hypothetical protein